ncbi:MAG: hypothetical protein JKY92_03670, partial [Magnetovibrio sp.]|nr:hypothetical protein [Magnetovibrio sp.]
LVPAFGMTSAAIILGETLTPIKAAGCTLIVLGLVVNIGLLKRLKNTLLKQE